MRHVFCPSCASDGSAARRPTARVPRNIRRSTAHSDLNAARELLSIVLAPVIIPLMRARVASMLLAVTLTACSSVSAPLPYKPEVQPPGASISAAYTVVSDRLRVEIDT